MAGLSSWHLSEGRKDEKRQPWENLGKTHSWQRELPAKAWRWERMTHVWRAACLVGCCAVSKEESAKSWSPRSLETVVKSREFIMPVARNHHRKVSCARVRVCVCVCVLKEPSACRVGNDLWEQNGRKEWTWRNTQGVGFIVAWARG